MLGRYALVAVTDGEIQGYIFARAMADEGEVLNVAVRPDIRRQGLGRQLLDTVLEGFRNEGVATVYLEVRASNAAGRAFYDKLGFQEVGRRRGYYNRPKEDALVLARKLTPAGHRA
jgi:ribosomal-protein-alanine N-acetyltransferase